MKAGGSAREEPAAAAGPVVAHGRVERGPVAEGEGAPGSSAAEPPLAEADWERFLGSRVSRPVRVVYGRSRTSPLQARRAPGDRAAPARCGDAWLLRLHTMFAGAPADVREAVADLLRSGRRAKRSCAVLDAWIAATLPSHPPPRLPDSALSHRGRHHDLARIAAELVERELAAEFGGARGVPRLTWGRTRGRSPRRGMRLGSYDPELDVVRVHPALDQAGVPESFVRYVVFHELLHAMYPPVRGSDGRWVRHGEAFRARERGYPDLESALAWERRHIDALIRSARTGRPLRKDARAPARALELVQRLLFPEAFPLRGAPKARPRPAERGADRAQRRA